MSGYKQRLSQYLHLAAPIQDYGYFGPNAEGSIDGPSQRIAQNLKFEAKLRRFYQNTPYPINVWVVNDPLMIDRLGIGEMRLDVAQRIEPSFGRYLKENYKVTRQAINFIIAGDVKAADSNALPLTPWIVGHRLGHVLVGDAFSELIVTYLHTLFISVYSDGLPPHATDTRVKSRLATNYISMFDFKSIRDNQVKTTTELTYEIFTKWLITGQVMPVFPEQVGKYRPYFEPTADVDAQKRAVNDFNAAIGKLFNRLLKNAIGKFYVD